VDATEREGDMGGVQEDQKLATIAMNGHVWLEMTRWCRADFEEMRLIDSIVSFPASLRQWRGGRASARLEGARRGLVLRHEGMRGLWFHVHDKRTGRARVGVAARVYALHRSALRHERPKYAAEPNFFLCITYHSYIIYLVMIIEMLRPRGTERRR
jgi:hypothetical protein